MILWWTSESEFRELESVEIVKISCGKFFSAQSRELVFDHFFQWHVDVFIK